MNRSVQGEWPSLAAGRMPQWVRELAMQTEGLSSDPITHVEGQVWPHEPVTPGLWEAEAHGSLEFAFGPLPGSRRDSFKEKR